MAVANAIGSNVFDILLGLGLPWFCVTISGKKPFVKVDKSAMTTSVLILLATVGLFLATLQFSRWRMDKRYTVSVRYGTTRTIYCST
jgi:Ca2+/Na+ antiporter